MDAKFAGSACSPTCEASSSGIRRWRKAGKATMQRAFSRLRSCTRSGVHYYLEKRDPEFESKMKDIFAGLSGSCAARMNRGPMKQPGASLPSRWMRNRDCRPSPIPLRIDLRLPTSTLPSGATTNTSDWALVRFLAALGPARRPCKPPASNGGTRSREFIGLLKDLDTRYPAGCTIRLVLDNHSAHISKETRAFLHTRPNRFQYALTPKHGSWLNIVETLFGKMARTFLRHIRVQSWAELRQRILQGIAEINAAPVVHRWRKFDALKPADQEMV